MSKVEVNEIRPQCGTTVTLGGSGETIALGACAASSGFGAITWCSSIKTALFTAAAGKGYFINTCGGGYTVTLPATASVGDQINFTDYARTWCAACKNLTLDQGSLKFQGQTCPNPVYDTAGATVKIIYSGATQGWLPQLDKGTSDEVPQTYNVEYLVVAGGGGGGAGTDNGGGGGGAGGYRTAASFSVVSGSSYPIQIGGGGAGGTAPGPCAAVTGTTGTNSVFSSITSAGGGGAGGASTPGKCGLDGGSGGGGAGDGDG